MYNLRIICFFLDSTEIPLDDLQFQTDLFLGLYALPHLTLCFNPACNPFRGAHECLGSRLASLFPLPTSILSHKSYHPPIRDFLSLKDLSLTRLYIKKVTRVQCKQSAASMVRCVHGQYRV